jgi:large repetitive protein
VFAVSAGLGPFVETNPTSGNVGAAITILGTSLTGATSVTFNGIAATFTVVSSSEITTTVPTGATTGTVQVVTPSGTLSSNVPFQVL